MSSAPHAGYAPRDGFRHEAMLYAGDDMFVDRCERFVRAGLEAGEPVLVVVEGRKIDLLREALGRESAEVEFADMRVLGENPARIIPAWRAFADRNSEARVIRGVGEPISPARRPDELDECQRHEMLINVALHDTPGMWLVCPYDTDALDEAVVAEAQCSHPFMSDAPSERFNAPGAGPFDGAFPDPVAGAIDVPFNIDRLGAVRRAVSEVAADHGLSEARSGALVMAANEVMTNSIRHAREPHGRLVLWAQDGALVCEIADDGYIDDPLAGRVAPVRGQINGHGLWLANMVCDLVQIRSSPQGTRIRLKMRLDHLS
jgi:anti-sigma regulatory factor (Ser/Thr protein kinase)